MQTQCHQQRNEQRIHLARNLLETLQTESVTCGSYLAQKIGGNTEGKLIQASFHFTSSHLLFNQPCISPFLSYNKKTNIKNCDVNVKAHIAKWTWIFYVNIIVFRHLSLFEIQMQTGFCLFDFFLSFSKKSPSHWPWIPISAYASHLPCYKLATCQGCDPATQQYSFLLLMPRFLSVLAATTPPKGS